MKKRLYLVDGYRTPFSKFGTDLSDEPVPQLGISPTKHLFTTTGLDPKDVDHVVFGCCNQPGTTLGNVARTIGVRSGVPYEVPAVTVHRNCASGFEAITYAYDKAQANQGDVFLVGGVESMSQAPFLFNNDAVKKFTKLSRSRSITQKLTNLVKFRPSDFAPEVSLKLAMVDSLCDLNMGQTAELLARENNISRFEQDEYAENSHIKAIKAQTLKTFDDEISPYRLTKNDCIRSFNGKTLRADNGPRLDAYVEKLADLRTVFDRQGTVTAGNASQVTDGGAAALVMTKQGLQKTGAKPLAEIVTYEYAGCDPSRMGLGPVHAINRMTQNLECFDLVEINEAFAAQVLACNKQLQIPEEKLNVNGGAIALGHPLAASGVRLVITLSKELKRRKLTQGIASLCVGGGQGGAIWLKSV